VNEKGKREQWYDRDIPMYRKIKRKQKPNQVYPYPDLPVLAEILGYLPSCI
jgi:hypothetical protein